MVVVLMVIMVLLTQDTLLCRFRLAGRDAMLTEGISDQTAVMPHNRSISDAGLMKIPRGQREQARSRETLVWQDESRGSR